VALGKVDALRASLRGYGDAAAATVVASESTLKDAATLPELNAFCAANGIEIEQAHRVTAAPAAENGNVSAAEASPPPHADDNGNCNVADGEVMSDIDVARADIVAQLHARAAADAAKQATHDAALSAAGTRLTALSDVRSVAALVELLAAESRAEQRSEFARLHARIDAAAAAGQVNTDEKLAELVGECATIAVAESTRTIVAVSNQVLEVARNALPALCVLLPLGYRDGDSLMGRDVAGGVGDAVALDVAASVSVHGLKTLINDLSSRRWSDALTKRSRLFFMCEYEQYEFGADCDCDGEEAVDDAPLPNASDGIARATPASAASAAVSASRQPVDGRSEAYYHLTGQSVVRQLPFLQLLLLAFFVTLYIPLLRSNSQLRSFGFEVTTMKECVTRLLPVLHATLSILTAFARVNSVASFITHALGGDGECARLVCFWLPLFCCSSRKPLLINLTTTSHSASCARR
jgi:hypothetical protein